MMNGKNSQIVVTTYSTSSAERFEKCDFALPVPTPFLKPIAIDVPEMLLTFWRTKLCRSRFAAEGAFTGMPPAVSMVACHTTKPDSCLLLPRDKNLERFAAMLTNNTYSGFCSHVSMIAFHGQIVKSKYFEIAQRRIAEAEAQLRLPLEV